MENKKTEVEKLANELSLETDDVQLSNKDGIEKAFYIQMATNLISKGYRLSEKSPQKCGCTFSKENPAKVVCSRCYGEIGAKKELVPLDEHKLTVMFEKYLEPHTSGWRIKQIYIDNVEYFKFFIRDICATFGTLPRVELSVEDLVDCMYKLEFDGSLSQHDFKAIATAIHQKLIGGK